MLCIKYKLALERRRRVSNYIPTEIQTKHRNENSYHQAFLSCGDTDFVLSSFEMAFNLRIAGVRVSLTPSGSSATNFLSGVRQCNGHIEADLLNFTGTIVLCEDTHADSKIVSGSSEVDKTNNVISREGFIVKDIVGGSNNLSLHSIADTGRYNNSPEGSLIGTSRTSSEDNSSDMTTVNAVPDTASRSVAFDVLPMLQQGEPGGYVHHKIQDPYHPPETKQSNGYHVVQQIQLNDEESKNYTNFSFHEACASEDVDIEDLFAMLRRDPELASQQDEFGDYPAHIFANNDALIYTTESDDDLVDFLFELYCAFPGAFFAEGRSGQIPFAGAICDWIDDCHQLYHRDETSVYRVSELKTLSNSDRVINSLCVRAEVQMLSQLPERVALTPKVAYSFKMLSALLDRLSQAALEDISQRREFFLTSWKRRDKIIRGVASLPFLIRTVLLIESPTERDALLQTSIIKNSIFCVESVGLWLVGMYLCSALPALLAGCPRSKNCARYYLCLVSRSSISDLYGKDAPWSRQDIERFHDSRKELYNRIGKLGGLLPIMLHLGDHLYEVSTKRSVKHVVESVLGTPFVVYLNFSEMICLLVLNCTYRIIIELLYNSSEPVGTSYREFWGLAFTTAVFFTLKDIGIMLGFFSFEEHLWRRHLTSVSTIVGMFTMISVFASLGIIYVDENIHGRNFLGLVMGLLWWKLVLHLKGMSSSLSTLIYTILQIAGSLKYFLLIFLILIICFADMIQIVTKTSNQCDGDADFETLCSLTPVQSYVAMYGIMIGGMEMSSLAEFSPLVIVLFISATFLGLIVLVNILIAIVTSEYEDACNKSHALFARARLEQAARHVAREKFFDPQGDPAHFEVGVKIWRKFWKISYFILFLSQEFFLVKSLVSCNDLRKQGIVDNFYFISLVIYGIMYHVLLIATGMAVSAMAISQYEFLARFKEGRLHKFTQIGLKPVCLYLRSMGLFKSESCNECSK
ncbi:hypothetical protein HJC23_010067 [Cyclotella cryptica]|uniref:Ion transport domain-containing protein n=1 Tax=Cyclotella cryptica TaxID=29204 RepID=A0ABD3Q457_9STRA|eukprot:CCRYP_009046-RA/>CCRYP_009046-RA protein AED:0.10 eAED:0.10 QI:218/0.91/0.92/1/0.83/0.84/13/1398/973